MRRYLIAIISATAVAASFLPSQAAGYEFNYGAVRSITFSASIAGGTASGWLKRYDNIEFSASGTGRPNPAQDLQYFGCLSIKTSVGSDSSCAILRGAAISLDPVMHTVTAAWSVDSKLQPGQRPPFKIFASLIFNGTSAPAVGTTPSVTRNGTAVLLESGPSIARSGSVIGFVKSEGEVNGRKIGGGQITSTTSAVAALGTDGSVHVHHP